MRALLPSAEFKALLYDLVELCYQHEGFLQGFPLKVVEKKGRWLKVSDFENDVGWVYRKLTSRSAHLIVKVHKDKKKKINIRNGPGTEYKVIGQAYYGVVFKTLKRGKGWVKVQHENGLTGWVQRSLVWGW